MDKIGDEMQKASRQQKKGRSVRRILGSCSAFNDCCNRMKRPFCLRIRVRIFVFAFLDGSYLTHRVKMGDRGGDVM